MRQIFLKLDYKVEWDYKVRQVWITNCDRITKRNGLQSDTVQRPRMFVHADKHAGEHIYNYLKTV